MMNLNLKKLKSGTDVRGIAVEGENKITLTNEAVTLITKAFVKWLAEKTGKNSFKIAVGNDSRISANRIAKCVKDALLSSGCDMVYTALSSTPSMFILLQQPDYGCDASIMITASHMPYDRNGLKFFTKNGGINGEELNEILEIAQNGEFLTGIGTYENRPFIDGYSKILVETVEKACGKLPLKGKKIVVDAGNGAGGFFAEKVLIPLGADITGSRYLEPDGYFPNHIPNPEDKTAINSLKDAVKESCADFGVIFDTDVDRAACVGADGEEINRNSLIALISAILLKERAGVIVTDSVTSGGLTEFIESLGGKHLRFKRGYKNVIDKCRELNESGIYSPLAIETSGHAAFKENHYLDDGAYLIVKLLISLSQLTKQGKDLTSLISSLKKPEEEAEIRIGFSEKSRDFKAEGANLIEELKEIATQTAGLSVEKENYEGVRIYFNGGLMLVRMSVHDPVMPINIESDKKGGVKTAAKKLLNLLSHYEFLNTENLQKFIKSF